MPTSPYASRRAGPDKPSAEALVDAEQLLPYTWRNQPDYEAVLVDVARALDRWRDYWRQKARNEAKAEIEDWRGRLASQCGETLAATQKERNRIAAYLDFHEYDITSGIMDPLRALRRELGVKEAGE